MGSGLMFRCFFIAPQKNLMKQAIDGFICAFRYLMPLFADVMSVVMDSISDDKFYYEDDLSASKELSCVQSYELISFDFGRYWEWQCSELWSCSKWQN